MGRPFHVWSRIFRHVKLCRIVDCAKPIRCRGLCDMHYTRLLRHGDPEITHRPERYMTIEDRFWAKVNTNGPLGCWLWTGAVGQAGHGIFVPVRGKRIQAHRWLWEVTRGPIPEGMELDHICRVPACVRPAHLEAVTHRENCRRGISPAAINARKTHCQRGHEFTAENTYVTRTGSRCCRRCQAIYQQKLRAARRLQRLVPD